MRVRVVTGGIAFAGTLAIAACELAFPTVAASPDASVPAPDASPETGVDAADAGCVLAVPPSAPAQSTGAGDEDFIVAVQTLGIPDGGPPVGFDLDGVCSTCPNPITSCVGKVPHCDGPGGRDTAGNAAFQTLNDYFATTSAGNLATRISHGKLGFLFEVRGYSGGKDDDQVTFVGYLSAGIIVDAFGNTQPPTWDGNDAWSVDPTSTGAVPRQIDGGYAYTPKFITTTAYVTNGTLVARLPTFELGVGVGKFTLVDAVFVATISSDASGRRLDGQFAGRAPTADLLGLFGGFTDPLDGSAFLCGSDPTYRTFRDELCQAADIARDPSADNTGAVCNGLAMGLAFTAGAAKLGVPFAPKYPPPGCDGAVDDCTP